MLLHEACPGLQDLTSSEWSLGTNPRGISDTLNPNPARVPGELAASAGADGFMRRAGQQQLKFLQVILGPKTLAGL